MSKVNGTVASELRLLREAITRLQEIIDPASKHTLSQSSLDQATKRYRDPKPDPVKELRKILREKWDARDEAQAKKDIPKLIEALRNQREKGQGEVDQNNRRF